MLEPNAGVNSAGDDAWFGVLTWVQPEEDVKRGKLRLVRIRVGSPLLSFVSRHS